MAKREKDFVHSANGDISARFTKPKRVFLYETPIGYDIALETKKGEHVRFSFFVIRGEMFVKASKGD